LPLIQNHSGDDSNDLPFQLAHIVLIFAQEVAADRSHPCGGDLIIRAGIITRARR
jgi:hypothetical protein